MCEGKNLKNYSYTLVPANGQSLNNQDALWRGMPRMPLPI